MLLPSHKPSPLLFLKFVYVTRPLRHSLVVHTLPKKKKPGSPSKSPEKPLGLSTVKGGQFQLKID